MTLFNTMFQVLGPLVGGRCYEDAFPQTPTPIVVPAIRISLVSGEVFPDLCGNDITTGSPRYQIDLIDASAHARNALVPSICAAIDALTPPAALDGLPSNSFDAETKRYRASFDYVFQPSSAP